MESNKLTLDKIIIEETHEYCLYDELNTEVSCEDVAYNRYIFYKNMSIEFIRMGILESNSQMMRTNFCSQGVGYRRASNTWFNVYQHLTRDK